MKVVTILIEIFTYLVTVCLARDKECINQPEEAEGVTNAATIRFNQSNSWLEIAELLNSNLEKLVKNLQNQHVSQTIKKSKSVAQKIEIVTFVNNTLAEVVVNEWSNLPDEAKDTIKRVAEIQYNHEDDIGNWNSFNLKQRVLIAFTSLIKGKDLVAEYNKSATNFTSEVLKTLEIPTIFVSDTDMKLILKEIESPTEFSDEVKLDIANFRKKYNV